MKIWKTVLCLSTAAWMLDCVSITGGGGTEAEGLSGQLVNAQGKPAVGASVKVYDFDNGTGALSMSQNTAAKDTALTDAKGRFRFPNLKDGRYNVEALSQKDSGAQGTFIPDVLLKGSLN